MANTIRPAPRVARSAPPMAELDKSMPPSIQAAHRLREPFGNARREQRCRGSGSSRGKTGYGHRMYKAIACSSAAKCFLYLPTPPSTDARSLSLRRSESKDKGHPAVLAVASIARAITGSPCRRLRRHRSATVRRRQEWRSGSAREQSCARCRATGSTAMPISVVDRLDDAPDHKSNQPDDRRPDQGRS